MYLTYLIYRGQPPPTTRERLEGPTPLVLISRLEPDFAPKRGSTRGDPVDQRAAAHAAGFGGMGG